MQPFRDGSHGSPILPVVQDTEFPGTLGQSSCSASSSSWVSGSTGSAERPLCTPARSTLLRSSGLEDHSGHPAIIEGSNELPPVRGLVTASVTGQQHGSRALSPEPRVDADSARRRLRRKVSVARGPDEGGSSAAHSDVRCVEVSQATPALDAADAADAANSDALQTFPRAVHKKAWARMRELFCSERATAFRADEHSAPAQCWEARRHDARVAFQELDAAARAALAHRALLLAVERGDLPEVVQCLRRKAQGPAEGQFFVDRKCAVLLTYNGPWGLVHGAGLAAEVFDAAVPAESAAVALRNHVPLQNLWRRFQDRIVQIADSTSSNRWSACFEVCGRSLSRATVPRVHAHVFLESTQPLSIARADALCVLNTIPYRSQEQILHLNGRGRASHTAAAAGHYYVRCPKVGSVWSVGSHEPYKDYPVKAEWVTAYWQAGKLSDEGATAEYIKVKRDCVRHVQNVKDNARLRQQLLQTHLSSEVQGRLHVAKCPRASVPQVEHVFIPQFANAQLARRKFLVLEGPSCVGKTEYARGLAPSPAAVLELNCANQLEHVDLRALSPSLHKVILWDEAHPRLILSNKKLIQGQAVQIQLGQTNTSVHSYTVFPWGIMMVVCSNNWSPLLRTLAAEDEDWLRANSVHVRVEQPLWVEHAAS